MLLGLINKAISVDGFCRPLICVVLFGMFSTTANGQESVMPAVMSVNEPDWASDALHNAKFSLIGTSENDLSRLLTSAINKRIDGDLRGSISDSEACFTRARADERLLSDYGAACKELMSGSYYISGNIQAWAKSSIELEDAFKSTFARYINSSRFEVANYSGIDFKSFEKLGTETIARIVAGEVVLPRVLDPRDDMPQPVAIKITVNGSEQLAIIDTGSSVSIINSAVAERLGIPSLTDNYIPIGDPTRGARIASQLAEITSLQLGSVLISNAKFAVAKAPTTIGLDVLFKLAPLTFRDKDVVLFSSGQSCSERAYLKSDWLGDFSMLAKWNVNGKPEYVHLDTGDDATIAELRPGGVSASEVGSSRRVYAVGGLSNMKFIGARFNVNNLQIAGEIRPEFPVSGYKFRVGSEILEKNDLRIERAPLSACLSSR